MTIKELLKKPYHFANRVTKPVVYGKKSIEPISKKMGYERGMPIDRYYIETFLKQNRNLITGDVLEIAEDQYTRRFGTGDVVSHILSYKGEQKGSGRIIEGDLTKPDTLPEETIDCFICTQTLNFIYDVHVAVKGIHKVLRPGGRALVTVAGASQISRYDYERWGDYWRFSDLAIKKLFLECFKEEKLKVVTFGNLAALMALLQGFAVEDLEHPGILDQKDPDYPCTIGVVATR